MNPDDVVELSEDRGQPLDKYFPRPVERKIDPNKPVFDAGEKFGAGHRSMVGMFPKKRDPVIDAMIQAFIAKNGVTKLPPGLAEDYAGQMKDDAQFYGRKHGTGVFGALEAIRKSSYADHLSIVGGFSTLEDELHGRRCALPTCLEPLNDKRPQAKYCNGTCSKKDRRRLKMLPKIVANGAEKLVRVLSPTIAPVGSEKQNENSELDNGGEQKTESQNTYREESTEIDPAGRSRNTREDPFGRLLVGGEIDQHQYDAATALQHDLDSVDGRLRAPERDILDISVWRPRATDSNDLTASRSQISAVAVALGPNGVTIVRDALAGRPVDTVSLRQSLNKLAVVYGAST